MCVNGYMQSYTWPMLLMIVHSQFNPDRYSSLLGFWSTNANVGNIIGFGVSKLILNQGENEWTLVLAVSGLYAAIMGAIVFFRFSELKVPAKAEEVEIIKSLTAEEVPASSISIFGYEAESTSAASHFKDPALILLTITFSLTKSVIYGILLWVNIASFSCLFTSSPTKSSKTMLLKSLSHMTSQPSSAPYFWGTCSRRSSIKDFCSTPS